MIVVNPPFFGGLIAQFHSSGNNVRFYSDERGEKDGPKTILFLCGAHLRNFCPGAFFQWQRALFIWCFGNCFYADRFNCAIHFFEKISHPGIGGRIWKIN